MSDTEFSRHCGFTVELTKKLPPLQSGFGNSMISSHYQEFQNKTNSIKKK